MSPAGGRFRPGRRLRERLADERPVWGLRQPATAQVDSDGVVHVAIESDADRALLEGFVAAATSMPEMDLERRLWSGRLAELLGEPGPYDVEVASLDWFVRTLGFRHDAEAAWKALDGGTRATCEAYARGVNAWIDSGDWSRDAAWSALESRPRLWAPSDCLLLRDAPVCVDGSGDVPFSAPGHAAWTADWNRRCSALWAALHGTPLRAPGGAAAGRRFRWVFCAEGGQEQLLESTAGTPSSSAAQPPSAREAPRLVPVELLDEGPHRFARPDGRWGKLRAKRTDLAVRGEPSPRRAWVRRAPSGGLVSDVFAGASATDAPTGTGFAWSWGEVRPSAGPSPSWPALPAGHPARLLDPDRRRPFRGARLVPLEGGA